MAFKDTFSWKNVHVKFVGVWDTVGALGIPAHGILFGKEYYTWHDTELSGWVHNAYHAVAMDEHRADFAATMWSKAKKPKKGQHVEQRFFPGAHADVGGGYKDQQGLGPARIKKYLELFGWGSATGIDLPGENSGFLPSKEWKEETKNEKWYIGDTYNVSIGQGDVLVTPLQIASMTSVIANGGTLYRPKILKSIVRSDYLEEIGVEKEIIRENFIDTIYLRTVRQGMKDCVEYGSCRRLASLPMETAGKTGTAQWSSTKSPHAWYTSFAPYYNPSVVLTILIEEGEGGSSAAIPVADEFYRWWYYY